MTQDPAGLPPLNGPVTSTLARFKSVHISEQWQKALERLDGDAEGALTTARELIESICKHVLDEAKIPHDRHWNLGQLYNATAKALQIAPSQQTEDDFKRIMGACSTIVQGLGNLRSNLGDSHGKGKDAARAAARHAELAVNLAGAMAIYLVKTWEARQRTIGDLIRYYLAEVPRANIGESMGYALQAMLRSPLEGIIASQLTKDHIVAYCVQRIKDGAKPPTVRQYVGFLRAPLQLARITWGLELPTSALHQARLFLREQKMIASSTRREQRFTSDDFEKFMALFREQETDPRSKIKMTVLMEFALETARMVGEICELRWSDVNLANGMYRTQGIAMDLPLSEKARTIIRDRQPATGDHIFPWNSHSASAKFVAAKKILKINHVTFQDIRFEKIIRLMEEGYGPHEVTRLTGIRDAIELSRLWDKYGNAGRQLRVVQR
jgi:integrase